MTGSSEPGPLADRQRELILPPVLVLVAFVAIGLYLVATLGWRSLWFDELLSIYVADPSQSLATLVATRLRYDLHPPLYFVLLHYWMLLFGDEPAVMRLLSFMPVPLGALAIWFAWRRGLVRLPVDLIGLFLLTSFGLVYYSHEARSYSFLLLWGLLLTLLLVHYSQFGPSWSRGVPLRFLAALLAISVLGALTHYFGLLFAGAVIATMAGERLLQKDWKSLGLLCAVGVTVLAVGLGWIAYTEHVIGRAASDFWIKLDKDQLVVLAKSMARLFFSGNVVLVGLILWGALHCARRVWFRRDVVLTSAAVGLAVAAVCLISLVTPLFLPRYFIVFMPAVFVVAAIALEELFAQYRRVAAAAVVLLCFAGSFALDLYFDLKPVEQWRESAEHIISTCGQSRATVLVPPADLSVPSLNTEEAQYFPYRYFLRNSNVAIRGATPDALEEAFSSSCPVLLWAAHVNGDDIDRMLAELGIEKATVDVVEFTKAFLVVKKTGKG